MCTACVYVCGTALHHRHVQLPSRVATPTACLNFATQASQALRRYAGWKTVPAPLLSRQFPRHHHTATRCPHAASRAVYLWVSTVRGAWLPEPQPAVRACTDKRNMHAWPPQLHNRPNRLTTLTQNTVSAPPIAPDLPAAIGDVDAVIRITGNPLSALRASVMDTNQQEMLGVTFTPAKLTLHLNDGVEAEFNLTSLPDGMPPMSVDGMLVPGAQKAARFLAHQLAAAFKAVNGGGRRHLLDAAGCDLTCDTKCNLRCCRTHDICFATHGCSAASWFGTICLAAGMGATVGAGPLGVATCTALFFSTSTMPISCTLCNLQVAGCVTAGCLLRPMLGLPTDNVGDTCYESKCKKSYTCPGVCDKCNGRLWDDTNCCDCREGACPCATPADCPEYANGPQVCVNDKCCSRGDECCEQAKPCVDLAPASDFSQDLCATIVGRSDVCGNHNLEVHEGGPEHWTTFISNCDCNQWAVPKGCWMSSFWAPPRLLIASTRLQGVWAIQDGHAEMCTANDGILLPLSDFPNDCVTPFETSRNGNGLCCETATKRYCKSIDSIAPSCPCN